MREAERALCTASRQIASDVRERFGSDKKLDHAHREAVLKLTRQALALSEGAMSDTQVVCGVKSMER
jgi:hypothetical protein